MSRAFVNEDAASSPEPRYDLPDRDSEYYEEAAAWALIQGADAGDSRSAERATGYRWGEPKLAEHVRRILARAEEEDRPRVAQLAPLSTGGGGGEVTAARTPGSTIAAGRVLVVS